MKRIFVLIAIVAISTLNAQEVATDSLPYATIPEAPQTYTAGTVVSRMIDGLGFRYHWATEGLTEQAIHYAPDNEGRTIAETMDHVYNLSLVILKSAQRQPRDFTVDLPELTLEGKRKATLEQLRMASMLFSKAKRLEDFPVVFVRENGRSEFPFWNNINGPIEDAVWHAGQIVTLRRIAGNPINPKVNVFQGKLND
ncbi:hypothetical protein [Maribacter sp. 2-571]|uniref:hypothetical protein n=1 Tax=Maribacter sp. 2-571 TaxID=3417569 RepID=UPI003D355655